MAILGIGWYRKEQWDYLRSIAPDRDALEPTWEEWAEFAENKVIELMKAGQQIQKVPVDIGELERWCRSRNRPCDAFARTEYITARLSQRK